MDILIEIVLEIYMELMMLVVPKEKVTKRHKAIAICFALFVLAGVFALVIWGCALLIDHNNLLGVIPIVSAAILSLAQIIAGILLYKRKR